MSTPLCTQEALESPESELTQQQAGPQEPTSIHQSGCALGQTSTTAPSRAPQEIKSDTSPQEIGDFANWRHRFRNSVLNTKGMATLEYALVCVAAAAFAGLLYVIVSSGAVEDALRGIIEDALNSRK